MIYETHLAHLFSQGNVKLLLNFDTSMEVETSKYFEIDTNQHEFRCITLFSMFKKNLEF